MARMGAFLALAFSVVRDRLIANGFRKGAITFARDRPSRACSRTGGQDQAILTYREEGRVPVVRDRLIANGSGKGPEPL